MTGQEALRQSLATRRGELMPVVKRILAVSPELDAAKFGDEELEQFVNAFVSLLTEALENRGTETRAVVLETAVPALLAAGETAESLVSTVAASIPLYQAFLVEGVPEELRDEAVGWLATFWGEYARDLYRAIAAAESEEGLA